MNQLEIQINELTKRIKVLEDKLTYGKTDHEFAELIRDIVFPDIDSSTARSSTVNVVSVGSPLTYPKVPDIYIRFPVRGKTYNLGAYNLL